MTEQFGSPVMVTRGQIYDATMLSGLLATQDGAPCGFLLFYSEADTCEIVALAATSPGRGIGTALIAAMRDQARELGCTRLIVITTNDNLRALGFYQKRGFRLVAIHPDAVELTRAFKPEIPDIGENGIPLRDEIELALPI
jgi:ribosomal protein S18 acetylase RimI-like enzyme